MAATKKQVERTATKKVPARKKAAKGKTADGPASGRKKAASSAAQRKKGDTEGRRSKTAAARATKTQPATRKPAKSPAKGKIPARRATQPRIVSRLPQQSPFPIVGIGASAGGLQAFEEFFSHLPPDPGMAFVLISHLDPDHASILHELLRRSTSLPVEQATDAVTIEPNHVYVGPPGKDVAIMNGTLQLMKPTQAHGVRLPIDYWFRSLAQDQKERAIGIILSGNGSDGTLGVKAIKGESGMVMAQDPESAKFTGMPSSAIATGLIDYVLPAAGMPQQLIRYTRGAYLRTAELDVTAAAPMPAMIQKIFVLLRARTGHDFSLYKPSTIRRRIARRMNIHQIKDHKQYIRYLEENPQEIDLLFKELLIGVTNFFRDGEAFEALARAGLSKLIESRSETENGPLRVWVPGCSTGEEAFSIAILLRETMDRLKKHFDIQIFATDLDGQAIETARTGRYPHGIARDLTPGRLKRFFAKENDHYCIKKEIRESVIFAEQNLTKDPPFTKLDLVSCRNLLIYLQPDLQKRILPLFHYALKAGGLLFLGTSETTSGFGALFQVIDKRWKVFLRKEGATALHDAPQLPLLATREKHADVSGEASSRPGAHANITELSARLLSERYAPPSVVVNERGEIIYIHGQTGLYLQPAPGQPSHNILTMAREGLRLELAAALRKAAGQDDEIVHKDVQIKANGGFVRLDLKVSRVDAPESLRGLFLVTFDAARALAPPTPAKGKRTAAKGRTERETRLERELQYTKENLQGTIEELETSNEELKSTNEELQSTNEEMQSTNEELETSKEEMQSLNEEMQTVNAELQGKIEELSRANDDMTNLLNATDIATLFLDNQLCVKRFTTQATEVIRLLASDVGRPISDIVAKLDYHDLERDARTVLRTLTFTETEVRGENETWYLMRIMPYRTAENVIDGLVITFVNISRLKRAEKELARAQIWAYAQHTVDTVRQPLLVLDEALRVKSANRSFYRTFQVAPEETEGHFIYDLGSRQWDIPRLRELLTKILSEHTTIEDFEVEHEFESVGRRVLLINARRIEQEPGRAELVLLAIEDVTDYDRRERRATESEGR